MRKFEIVKGYENTVKLPFRATRYSAGYDFVSIRDIRIYPYAQYLYEDILYIIPTGIKVCMEEDDFLQLQVRSSLSKLGLVMVNAPGIIDADYYNNPKNEGHIHGMFVNLSHQEIFIKKGEAFMQGIFQKYFITEDDNTNNVRIGGFGSTNI